MSPRPATPRSAEAEALRIVFFGTPRSGKTNLLDAFERIASAEAETEPLLLKSAEHSPTAPRQVLPKVVLVDLPDSNLMARSCVLLDCDGEAAASLFQQPSLLERNRVRGELTEAIRQADALVLIVEARSTAGEIEAHFKAFEDFLQCLRAGRTFGREIGGWPIFLTLTKSDKLFEPGMPAHAWLEKVEREKDKLRAQFVERFDEVIEAPGGDVYTFGSLQLATEATATSMPDELRASAFSLESGTLNLDTFVPSVLEAAGEFHRRSAAARRRLKWTATGVTSLLATMLLLVLGLFAIGEPSPLEKLSNQVQTLQSRDESAANRLAEKNIAQRKAELERIEQSREFADLSPNLQRFVQGRLREIDAYTAYKSEFAAPQFAPADVRTLGMYQRLQLELETKLAPPGEFASEWGETEAVRLRQKWRGDLRLLEEYEDRVHNWYRRLIADANELGNNPMSAGWRAQIDRLIRESGEPPFPGVDTGGKPWTALPVPESPALPIVRGESLTYGNILRYERADFAKRDWEVAERRLLDLRDLSDALGLTTDTAFSNETPVLLLPEPTGNRAESLALAGKRLERLKARFPRAAAGTALWQTSTFPEPLRQELARRLTLAAEIGQRHVRFLLDGELHLDNGRADRPADWRKLVAPNDGLLLRPELQAWGRLLQLLLTWSDPNRGEADPVAELAEFLKRDTHAIPISAIEIYLPNSLRVQVLSPAGALQLTIAPEVGPVRVLSLKLSSEVKSDTNGSTYRFVPDIPLTPLDYKPGERFSADLPLKAGANLYVMSWTRSRTHSFAFEKLLLDPDLERTQPAEKPQRAPGVRVKILPDKPGGFVPELLPALRGVN